MSDEEQNVTNQEEESKSENVAPPAEAKKTEQEHMIPKSRLDEVLSKLDEAQKRAEALDRANKEAEVARLKEAKNFEGLYNKTLAELQEIKPKAERVDAYQATIEEMLTAELQTIPEDRRSLIPDELSVDAKLRYISRNRSILSKAKPFDIGAGANGGGEQKSVDLTPDELQIAKDWGMKPEEYAKYKDKNI